MGCNINSGEVLDCRDSVGGVKTVYVAEFQYKGTPTTSSGQVTAWTAAANRFFIYELRPETADATCTVNASETNGTTFYTHTVNMKTFKMTAAKAQEFQRTSQQRLLVIVLDRNSTYWVYGLNNGLTMTAGAGQTGTAMGDMNGFNFTFAGGQEEVPYTVASGIIAGLTASSND